MDSWQSQSPWVLALSMPASGLTLCEEGTLLKPFYSEWLCPAKPNSNGYKREPIAFFEILIKDSES